MAQQVTITVSRHVEQAIIREAKARKMSVKDLCEELVEVALVNLGAFVGTTPVEERATRQQGDPMDDW